MLNLLISFVAVCVFLLGLVALISPLPIGVFLIGGSVSTLLYVNPWARKILQRWRIRSALVNAKMYWLEQKIERKFKKLFEKLIKTRPGENVDQ